MFSEILLAHTGMSHMKINVYAIKQLSNITKPMKVHIVFANLPFLLNISLKVEDKDIFLNKLVKVQPNM